MATTKTSKAVKVPHGTPIPEGMDLDTSEYVNEVGPHDDDITTHPLFHEDQLKPKNLQEKVDYLKTLRGDDPEKVIYARKPNTRTGKIGITLSYPDGDRFGAEGNTTEEAVAAMTEKLERLFPAEVTK